ncbi:MAG: hypothetical protein LC731_00435, partial [Acidobacteria bacterium]|nr:hypothetical protein [Acidobacteriota bacterium]
MQQSLRGAKAARFALFESAQARSSSRGCYARAVCVALLLFISAANAEAIPLSVYHERVRHAVISIGAVGTALQGEEREEETERAAVAELRRLLTEDETVEWPGGTMRVDNRWLKEAVDAYELLPVGDPKRTEALARIAERLQAIDERLTEIERQAGKAIDKDEEKARLAAILRREEYSRQTAEGNALTRLMKRFRDWIRSFFPKRDSTEPQAQSRVVDNTAQIIVTLLSLAVIVYVAWRFLPRFLRREMRKRKPKKKGARVVLGEKLDADANATDLLEEAEALARKGNLRAAIRKGYIALL